MIVFLKEILEIVNFEKKSQHENLPSVQRVKYPFFPLTEPFPLMFQHLYAIEEEGTRIDWSCVTSQNEIGSYCAIIANTNTMKMTTKLKL